MFFYGKKEFRHVKIIINKKKKSEEKKDILNSVLFFLEGKHYL
jgi:hypothetical protein